ncbi:MAG: alkaline phosphatase family protein [Eubacteriales bacterium]|nr:alkaline phosphatase family protein [Eubacteriales bacterium]
MNNKVVLVLVDGMVPESLKACGHGFVDKFLENSISNLNATTVMPSMTLPCHMSLFHSVTPQRHGVLTNTYTPQVRPINGLFDVLKSRGKNTASIYNWEQLRDLSCPGSLSYSHYISCYDYENTDNEVTDSAISYINEKDPDFVFIYLGNTDSTGHEHGWLSQEYFATVNNAWGCIEKICSAIPKEYTIIVTADHGGHDFMHGTELASDMTIPIIIKSPVPLQKSKKMEDANIIDIAPTIAKLMGVEPDGDWRGQSLIC